MSETSYQRKVIKRLEKEFADCVVIRIDPRYVQGYPDLLVLFHDRWAALEIKVSEDAPTQPNQSHYVATFDKMSYSAFIYPENEDEVFNELQSTFGFAG